MEVCLRKGCPGLKGDSEREDGRIWKEGTGRRRDGPPESMIKELLSIHHNCTD